MENLPESEPTRVLLADISQSLVAMLTGGRGHPPTEGAADNEAHALLLRELYRLSEAWGGLVGQKKTMADSGLWNLLLDACYNEEFEFLKGQGYTTKVATRLIRREQAWWESDSRQFATGAAPPEFCRSVPVIVVQREAGFRIHDEILAHLWQNPGFADGLSGAIAGSSSEVFKNTLGLVESIAQDYGFYDWEEFPLPEDVDGPDRWAIACLMDGLELESALEAECGGFFDDQDATPVEDLAWLVEAKRGNRLWQLLNAAVKLGRSLNQNETFRDSKIQNSTRKMLSAYPGKGATPAGLAVELIIAKAMDDGLENPTPEKLLDWLKGTRPHNDGDSLLVNHPMWESELTDVSWEKFENLVKSARRRVKSSPREQSNRDS